MDVEIGQVLFSDVVDEVLPLIRDNFNETSWHNDRPLALDVNLLKHLEQQGILYSFIARINGELVGYTTYFMSRHPHVEAKQAYQDVIYVKPEYRKGLTAVAHSLLLYAEHILISYGANYIINAAPVAHDKGYSRLLKRMGFEPVDSLFGKKV